MLYHNPKCIATMYVTMATISTTSTSLLRPPEILS